MCYLSVECGVYSLEYFDGDMRNLTRRFCGLKHTKLPTSLSNVVILKSSEAEDQYELNYEIKIMYRAVNKNTGKGI